MKIGLRIWVLIIALSFALLAIAPWKSLDRGVLITSVEQNSTEFQDGLRQGQIIQSFDGEKISNIDDFSRIISEKNPSGQFLKTTINTNEGEFIIYSNETLRITVSSLPKTNIKTGLDLSGGSRALVKAKDKELSSSEISDLVDVMSNRFNVYGISDVVVSSVSDLSGNNFVLVEIAGATPNDLENLISQQGKFEARIGNETVFTGGERDIASVCRSATCSRIDSPFQLTDGNFASNFNFGITLSENAARKHADVTGNLSTNLTDQGSYLSKTLDLYVDDQLVDSLLISEGLKGRLTTEISISGSGAGQTPDEALSNAEAEMKRLQTILITGELPYKLEIVKLDTLSPNLGKEFTKNIILLGLLAFLIISIILFVKYRKIKLTLSVIMTMFSEAFITLGVAALISWNLDAPSIAGIIAGMGTGVNDQIVILDESVSNRLISIKERIKRALFIIFGAFFTIVVAMLPLFWAGAGLLKGFAVTTIISVTVGILITRPAFAEIIKRIEE